MGLPTGLPDPRRGLGPHASGGAEDLGELQFMGRAGGGLPGRARAVVAARDREERPVLSRGRGLAGEGARRPVVSFAMVDGPWSPDLSLISLRAENEARKPDCPSGAPRSESLIAAQAHDRSPRPVATRDPEGSATMAVERDPTQVLIAASDDPGAVAREELFVLLYDELHACASRLMRRERPDHTLLPHALVHEAY